MQGMVWFLFLSQGEWFRIPCSGKQCFCFFVGEGGGAVRTFGPLQTLLGFRVLG